jgi:hypothetical protein
MVQRFGHRAKSRWGYRFDSETCETAYHRYEVNAVAAATAPPPAAHSAWAP